jgi:acyl transferase domain-containing protein
MSLIEHVQATASQTSVHFFSTVTGVEKTSGFGPSYWVQNLVSKVRFSEALEKLCNASLRVPGAESGALKHTVHLFLELGPHSALAGPSRQTIAALGKDGFQHHYNSCIVRGQDAIASVLSVAGKVYEYGQKINMKKVVSLNGSESRPVINDLPPYVCPSIV